MRSLALLLLSSIPLFGANPIGGGFLKAGLRGAYYDNPNLEGVPAFERKDPRIDFNWGSTIAPGGSHGRGFNSLGVDNYSVRWNAQIKTRFTETYNFTVIADDGVRLRVRPANDNNWTTLVDAWTQTGLSTNQAAFAFSATNTYELQLDYRELTGDASVRLFWESPSLPREIIDPAFEVSINWITHEEITFADAFMNGRGNWEQTALDAEGWPVGDGEFIVSEINAPHAPSPLEVGLLRLSFNGRADVSVYGNGFIVPGTYNYDPASNVSTADVRGQNFGANVLNLRFRNATRTGVAGGPGGVTNVKLMRPVPGSDNATLPPDELFHPSTRAAFADRLTALRFQRVNDQSREWNERTPPSWPYKGAGLSHPFVYAARYGYPFSGRTHMAHEYEIMLCNETGCDYYVTVPHLASTNYVRQLAQLIRYGSNQEGIPYAEPSPNPYHPPLNPNLRVYVEIANELWNFLSPGTYAPYGDYRELIEDMADANTADFQILNFDGLPLTLQPDGYYSNNYTWVRRYWGLKLKYISDVFRNVFGTSAMPGSGAQPRIRPYHGYQYANANQTAEIPFDFLDDYFNNGAGNFVADPHPVNYYIFAAGGAGYYSSGNPSGLTEGAIPNSSFETPGNWQFSGNAGIASNVARESMITSQTIGALRNNLSAWVGMRFTVGATPVWAYDLGRYVHAGNNRSHALVLVRASDGQLVTYAQAATGGVPGTYNFQRCAPALLAANTTYVLLAEEESGYDTFGNSDTTVVSSSPQITIQGAATATSSGNNVWNISNGPNGSVSFGPVNLRIAPAGALGNPDAFLGSNVAYISGNGAVEISFNSPPSTGTAVYGLAFRGVQRGQDSMQLRITANGADITYRGINGQPQAYSPFFPWRRVSYWIGDYFFSETFSVPAGQPITLRFEGLSDASQMCFLDDLQLTSVDAIFAAGIPDTGEATGQPSGGDYVQSLRMDARWAQSYGLHHMTYEHGWSLGGDSGASPVQEYAKYRDQRTAGTMVEAMDIFQRAGGANMTLGTYSTWPLFSETIREEGVLSPTNWPLVQGLDTAWQSLAPFPDNGVSVPAILTAGNRAIGFYTSENRVDAGEWMSWNVIVSQRALYNLSFALANGGAVQLTLNDAAILYAGAANGPQEIQAELTPGLHTLKIKGVSGSATFANGISLTIQGAPGAPVLSAVDGDGSASLSWTPAAGATSYLVRYGPEPGFPNASLNVGLNLNAQISNLQNGAPYYFTVVALNDSGLGLPSNETGVTPFGDGQLVDLVAWDFAGRSGDAPNASPSVASARVAASLLTRGNGFGIAGWAPSDCFMGASVSWAQTLEAAVGAQHYAEFTLTPSGGRTASISALNFRPGFQNFTGAESDPRGAGIAWRVGTNGTFSNPIAVPGPRTGTLNFCPLFTANLASVPQLQNVREPVTFRIYFHGMGPYEAGSIGGLGNDIAVIGSLRTPRLAVSINGGQFILEATRPVGSAPLQSTDLINWAPLAESPIIEPISDGWERAVYSLPLSGSAAFFKAN